MKTQGKIKPQCREETESVKKLEVPRADMSKARTFGKDEIDVLVKRMIKDINEKYTYEQCLLFLNVIEVDLKEVMYYYNFVKI